MDIDDVRKALDALGEGASLRDIRQFLGGSGSLETISALRQEVLRERGVIPPPEAPAEAPTGLDVAALAATITEQVTQAVLPQVMEAIQGQIGPLLAAQDTALITPALRAAILHMKRHAGLSFDAFTKLLRDFGRATQYEAVVAALVSEGTLSEADRGALSPAAVPPTPAPERPSWAPPECDCPECPPSRKRHWVCCGCGQRYAYGARMPHSTRTVASDPQGRGGVLASACSALCLDQYLRRVPQDDAPTAEREHRSRLLQRIAQRGAWRR